MELEESQQQEAVNQEAEAYIEQLSPHEFQALYNECATQFKTSEFWKPHFSSRLFESAVKNLMVKRVIADRLAE